MTRHGDGSVSQLRDASNSVVTNNSFVNTVYGCTGKILIDLLDSVYGYTGRSPHQFVEHSLRLHRESTSELQLSDVKQ